MNYYEELDISPASSANEIRQAYKLLARLLHPDQCSDPNLRRLAELQMRRLNEILTILADPDTRRRYDASLKSPVVWHRSEVEPPLVRPGRRRILVGLCAWLPPVAVAVAVLAALLYYGTENRQEAADSTPTDNSAARPAVAGPAFSPGSPRLLPDIPQTPSFENHKVPTDLRSAEGEGNATVAPRQPIPHPPVSPTLRDEFALEPSVAPPRAIPEARPSASSERADPLIERAAANISPTLAGHWYYVAAGRSMATNGMYMPEYIELRLLESGGVVSGHYVARYRVTDRAIDPNVVFEFDGPGIAPDAQFSWNGPGGASGRVSLRLVAADRLEVSWMATHLSGELNLASGNAQLIR